MEKRRRLLTVMFRLFDRAKRKRSETHDCMEQPPHFSLIRRLRVRLIKLRPCLLQGFQLLLLLLKLHLQLLLRRGLRRR